MIGLLLCLIVSLSIPQITSWDKTKDYRQSDKLGEKSNLNIHATLEYNYLTTTKLIHDNHIRLMENISIKQE